MQRLLACVRFVTGDPLLNLGASGSAFFGTILAFYLLGMPQASPMHIAAMFLTPLFLALLIVRALYRARTK